jgi:transcription elongation factor GreA
MGKTTYLTREGYNKLKKELEKLLEERPLIAKQIAEARDKGDLSENAEYDAAKEAQGMLEMKIAKLQETLSNAQIIDESQMDTSKVQMLTTVKLKNLKNGAVISYTIVSENESNLKEGKIAVNTPIAKGLLGKKVGEKVKIQVPSGTLEFEILDITL